MGSKVAYHPDGEHVIRFREEPHSYVDDKGRLYTSVTSLTKPYFPEFDSVSQAEKCSRGKNPLYAGRAPEDILTDWEAERTRGTGEGDNIHRYAEAVAAGWPSRPDPISDRCRQLFRQVDRANDYLKVGCGMIFVSAEMIAFSPRHLVAGMIDLILYQIRSRILWILDWKQNKKITTCNQWQTGIGPLSHLEATDTNKYTLQLSAYRYLLDHEGYFPEVSEIRLALIHLSEEDYRILPLVYFEAEIESMLKALQGGEQ